MDKLLGTSFLIICLHIGWVSGQQKSDQSQVKQSPQSLTIQEGRTSVLNCAYDNSAFDYFPWYRQYPGNSPALLIAIRSFVSKTEERRFTIFFNKSAKHLSLHIMASQPGDSATYFCAARDTGGSSYGKLTFGQGTVLTVYPIIHQPDPSVYKLRGPKSSNTSVCLLTDFASQDNVTQEMKHMVFRSGSTALDVKAMDSKSNGALAWSNSINFECNSAFETYAFYPSSEYSCDAKLVEKSFETDMNLNFQNLSVIALRILLLKVAGFNLLMTLRLWSS